MAIQRFDEGPGFGALLGSGVSSGISSGLKALRKERGEKSKQRELFELLKTGGLPENIAAAVAGAPAGLQKGLLWNLSQNQYGEQQPQQIEQQPQLQQQQPQLQQQQEQEPLPQRGRFWGLGQNQQQEQQVPSTKDLNSLKRVRMQLLKRAKSPKTKKKLMNQLTKMGLGETEIGVLMGTELTEDVAKFFLDNAGGDKNAARKLAKAFGYEV